jgi:hypothetical protein
MTDLLWLLAAFVAIGVVELLLWVLGCELVKAVRRMKP